MARTARRAAASRKVRKQFILDARLLADARRILRAPTDTDAVRQALELVRTNRTLRALHRSLKGTMPDLRDPFDRARG